jgi:cation diffusion facilitator CzcD-associated flavoprotein CzcO
MTDGGAAVLVIGAGPAGLAVAASLRKREISVVVLERGPAAGWSWRSRYDRLLLNSSRFLSRMPGLRYPRDGHFPSRDEVVAYLERYAEHHGLAVMTGTEAARVDRDNGVWHLHTDRGAMRSRFVVVATGPDKVPFIPPWPGRDGFDGMVMHAGSYRNALPFQGVDALVVGGGDSAGDIAVDLAEGGAAQVHMAIRTPPFIFPGTFLGLPADWFGIVALRMPVALSDAASALLRRIFVGDLSAYGLHVPPRGFFARNREFPISGIVDRGGFVRAVKAGRVEIVAGVERFEREDVVLMDGTRLQPKLVVAATGYRAGLQAMVGHLGVLDQRGLPLVHPPRTHPAAPDLYLFGYRYTPVGNLRQVRLDASNLARAIARRSRVRSSR